MMALTIEGIKNIEGEFPSIFNNITENMNKYDDRNTWKRLSFVKNIPIFRNLSQDNLYKI